MLESNYCRHKWLGDLEDNKYIFCAFVLYINGPSLFGSYDYLLSKHSLFVGQLLADILLALRARYIIYFTNDLLTGSDYSTN